MQKCRNRGQNTPDPPSRARDHSRAPLTGPRAKEGTLPLPLLRKGSILGDRLCQHHGGKRNPQGNGKAFPWWEDPR